MDEIKQHDAKFVKIMCDKKLIKSHKFYIIYNFNDEFEDIIIKSGISIITTYQYLPFVCSEIYEFIEEEELGIKIICDIFYNFCFNYLSNNCTHDKYYIVFIISRNKTINNYYYFGYHGNFLKSTFSALTINNIDDLDECYDTINQMEYIYIYLKLKN
jgi:hypothetical protein